MILNSTLKILHSTFYILNSIFYILHSRSKKKPLRIAKEPIKNYLLTYKKFNLFINTSLYDFPTGIVLSPIRTVFSSNTFIFSIGMM